MAELSNLHRRPMKLRQRRDETSNHAGLAHATRMSADDYERHSTILAGWEGIRKAYNHRFAQAAEPIRHNLSVPKLLKSCLEDTLSTAWEELTYFFTGYFSSNARFS